MIALEKLKEAEKLIQTKFPNFKCPKYGAYNEFTWDGVTNPKLPNGIPQVTFHAVNCCGFTQLPGSNTGLWSVEKFTDMDCAIWLCFLFAKGCTGMVASTGSPGKKNWSKQELNLLKIGFTPVFRGYNKSHGPNYVTLWFIQFNESYMPKGDYPPVVEAEAEVIPVPAVKVPVKKIAKKLAKKAVKEVSVVKVSRKAVAGAR